MIFIKVFKLKSKQLKNENNELIHAVDYDISWYQDNNKSEGGWTLERIYLNQPCLAGASNWKASTELLGGTPCQINSIANAANDTEKPKLIRAFPDSLNRVRLFFNKKINQNTVENITNYTLSENLTITNAILEFPNANTVLLTLTES